jgi:NitT/TauT family transport system substrate-binding protein
MGDEPFATEMVNSGEAAILVNLYNPDQSKKLLGGTFIHASLVTREDVYQQYPTAVKKVQRMFDKTLQWIAAHSVSELIEKLSSQPGFDVSNKEILSTVLKNNPGMSPETIAWQAEAVSTTENFVHAMANNQAELNLIFGSFVKGTPPN